MTNTETNFLQTICICGKPIDLQTAKKDILDRFRCTECLDLIEKEKIQRHDWQVKYTLASKMMAFIKEQKDIPPDIVKAIGDQFWELL